jgi:hypothetical protein
VRTFFGARKAERDPSKVGYIHGNLILVSHLSANSKRPLGRREELFHNLRHSVARLRE